MGPVRPDDGPVGHGRLVSYTTQENVVQEIARGIPATISLTIGAAVIWLGFGLLFGVLAAATAGRWPDRLDGGGRDGRRVDANCLARHRHPL